MEPSAKRPRLQQQGCTPTDGLAVMLTDVEDLQDGTLLLWGLAADRQTVLLRVNEYHPYFFIPCPHLVSPDSAQLQEPLAQDLLRLRTALNTRLPDELHLQGLQVLQLSPIMFYRPSQPDGVPYIQAHLKPGASAKKAAAAVEKIAAGGVAGFSWRQRGTQAFEADVKLIMRFLSDTSLSGGSWLWACPTPSTAPTHVPRSSTSTPAAPAPGLSVGPSQDLDSSSSGQQAGASGPGSGSGSGGGGGGGGGVLFELVPHGSSRRSSCDIEVVCSCRCLHSLTPDATQLAQQDWQPPALSQLQPLPQSLQSAAAAAAAGDILPLKLVVLDVLLAPADGADRSCNPAADPVVAIASHVTHTASSSNGQQSSGAGSAQQPDLSPAGEDGAGEAAAAGNPGPQTAGSSKVVFLLSSPAAGAALPPELRAEGVCVRLCPTERELLVSWKEWLLQQDPDGLVVFQVRDNLGVLAARFAALQVDGGSAFLSRAAGRFSKALTTKSVVQYSVAWVKSQSRMASTSNQETFKAEGMSGRVVYDVLRQVLTGQSLATFSLVDCCQSLLGLTLEIMPAHVIASLHRELATAAQAAAQAGQPQQQPRARRSAPASATAATPPPAPAGSTASDSAGSDAAPLGCNTAPVVVPEHLVPAVRAALRLARYSLARCGAVLGLMDRLASVPESFEMARATGLTLDQVAYNAQMIRTLSLLLRSAHRQGYILGGRQDAIQLVESPYLMHPVENKTAGLYTTPIATCDFASLYPSLYRAYNLCYTTLVHPDDVAAIGREQLTITPTGAAFLKPGTRAGILPAILGALMSARAATRATLKGVQQQQKQLAAASGSQPGGAAVELSHQLAARVAVLDGRQKALKLTANALYGFTGAQASPLQCAAIADSCLAMGAATCRAAVTAINEAVEDKQLGPKAAGAKVIYAQTDSVFVHFPVATPAEAVLLGQQAAQLVTQQLPAPIELKYERVMCPFLLLHVNRYAGRSFETVAAVEAGSGSLLVKGVRAVWRQSAPYIQHTLMGALQRILMQGDVPAAVSFVEGEITRLLTGHVGMWELAMTGGLWRVTGQQLERAAAAAGDEDEVSKHPGGGAAAAAAGGEAEDIKGPHTNLAVRLSKRDPNKKFLLGERLSYVLLTGSKSQDEAAEDPLTAVKEGMTPNYQLYWQNKLQTPLKEMFSTCLSPEQLRSLLHGPHTQFRASGTATGEVLEPLSSAPHADTPSSSILFAGLGSPVKGSPGAAAAAAGGGDGGGGGGGGRKSAVPWTPDSSGKKKGRAGGGGGGAGVAAAAAAVSPAAGGLGTPSPGKKAGGGRQQGRMKAFFATTARCLGCKAVMQGQGLFGASSSSSSSQQQQPQPPPGVDPGLCPACRREEGKLEAVYLHTVGEQAGAAASLGAAHSACRRCHSGGQMGVVVCENGECPCLYVRYQAERQLRGADQRLLRLEW